MSYLWVLDEALTQSGVGRERPGAGNAQTFIHRLRLQWSRRRAIRFEQSHRLSGTVRADNQSQRLVESEGSVVFGVEAPDASDQDLETTKASRWDQK